MLHCCHLLLSAPNDVVQSLTLSSPTTAPLCHPSPAAVLLLSLLAPACLHRPHQYLVVLSSARSIVRLPLRRPPLTFVIARRTIVSSFVACRSPPFAAHHQLLSFCSGFQPPLAFVTPIDGWLLHPLSPCFGRCHIPPPFSLVLIVMCCHNHLPRQPPPPSKTSPLLP